MKPLQIYTCFINCMLHAVVQIFEINGDFRGFAVDCIEDWIHCIHPGSLLCMKGLHIISPSLCSKPQNYKALYHITGLENRRANNLWSSNIIFRFSMSRRFEVPTPHILIWKKENKQHLNYIFISCFAQTLDNTKCKMSSAFINICQYVSYTVILSQP